MLPFSPSITQEAPKAPLWDLDKATSQVWSPGLWTPRRHGRLRGHDGAQVSAGSWSRWAKAHSRVQGSRGALADLTGGRIVLVSFSVEQFPTFSTVEIGVSVVNGP